MIRQVFSRLQPYVVDRTGQDTLRHVETIVNFAAKEMITTFSYLVHRSCELGKEEVLQALHNLYPSLPKEAKKETQRYSLAAICVMRSTPSCLAMLAKMGFVLSYVNATNHVYKPTSLVHYIISLSTHSDAHLSCLNILVEAGECTQMHELFCSLVCPDLLPLLQAPKHRAERMLSEIDSGQLKHDLFYTKDIVYLIFAYCTWDLPSPYRKDTKQTLEVIFGNPVHDVPHRVESVEAALEAALDAVDDGDVTPAFTKLLQQYPHLIVAQTMCMAHGWGDTPLNIDEARRILINEAEKNRDKVAQYMLAMSYMHSFPDLRLPSDDDLAFYWFTQAAEQGYIRAQRALYLYRDTDEVEKGIFWCQKAAEQGDLQAQYDLGNLLITSNRLVEAEKWLRRAADQGHASAQYLMATHYSKTHEEKISWFAKAARQESFLSLDALRMFSCQSIRQRIHPNSSLSSSIS